jgi:UDP-glucose 4-epimerase/UDP-arabinose 4-epimerase
MARGAVLVTGGAGYIGAHTSKALSEAGYLPVAYDNLSTGHREFVQWGPLVEGDIRDPARVADAISRFAVVAVLHFAAFALVGESVTAPDKYYDNNVVGTLGLLDGMRKSGCLTLVFSSTCAVYGVPDSSPIAETARPDPINPYGTSKLMVERILADFSTAFGLKSTVLRYFNAAGADPVAALGEWRDPETHIVPRAMMTLLGHFREFQVHGLNFPTPDGTAVRDYIHVTDLARAHVMAVEQLLAGNDGGTYNLGTGFGHSVREVVSAIEREAGQRLPLVEGPRRPGDPAVLVADARCAKDRLGFVPLHSDLATIIRSSWAWHRRIHARSAV